MSYKLWVDDVREPPAFDWKWAKTSEQACELVRRFGWPHQVSLDHDLGGEDTSMRFLHEMIADDMQIRDEFPEAQGFSEIEWKIHSANPVGRENLQNLINSYVNFTKNWN